MEFPHMPPEQIQPTESSPRAAAMRRTAGYRTGIITLRTSPMRAHMSAEVFERVVTPTAAFVLAYMDVSVRLRMLARDDSRVSM